MKHFTLKCCCVLLFCCGPAVARTQMSIHPNTLQFTEAEYEYGSGISVWDFNSDGWEDITVCDKPNGVRAYQNNGDGTFSFTHYFQDSGEVNHITWVDFDNDADYDLFYTVEFGPNRFYRNDGNGEFTDISYTINPYGISTRSEGCTWGDYDDDGFLDLYICNNVDYLHHNWLFHNNGDGTFVEVSEEQDVHDNYLPTLQATWTDFNDDGKLDLLVTEDHDHGNRYYRNNGNYFEEVSSQYNLNQELNSMSVTIGDYDNDIDLDLYVTNGIFGNVLMQNQNMYFVDVAPYAGVVVNKSCWAAAWLDFDMNGWDDLYVGTYSYQPWERQSFLYKQDSITHQFTWVQGNHSALDQLNVYSDVKWDFNRDLVHDLITSNAEPREVVIWKNDIEQGNAIRVSLEGVLSNRDAIGAKIYTHSAHLHKHLETHMGENYLAQESQYKVITLGPDEVVDSLIVKWPSGWIDRYYNLQAGEEYHFVEGGSYDIHIALDADPVICPGEDGVMLYTSDNEPGVWSNGQTSNEIVATQEGWYYVSRLNPFGYVSVDSIYVTVPEIASWQVYTSNPTCHDYSDGEVHILSDGTLQVHWSGNINTNELIGVEEGNYSCVIIDDWGCIYTESVSVDAPDPLMAEVVASELECWYDTPAFDVSIIGGIGGYNYNVTENTSSQNGVRHFTITSFDAAGCFVSNEVNVNVPAPIEMVNLTQPVCAEESTTPIIESIGGTGTVVVEWLNTSEATELMAGSYDVQLQDALGCTLDTVVVIQAYSSIEPSAVVSAAHSGLNDGSIELLISGGTAPYEVIWSNGATGLTLQNVPTGFYQYNIVDANGCDYTSDLIFVDVLDGINEFQRQEIILSSNGTHVVVSNGSGLEFKWMDARGRVVESGRLSSQSQSFFVGDWPSGVYILLVDDCVVKWVR